MSRFFSGPIRRALVIENPHPELDELLRRGGFEVVRVDKAPQEDQLIDLLTRHRTQVLFKRSRAEVSARVLDAAEDLVAVQLCSIGDDSVDKAAAARRGVLVFNDPVSNGRSVVELVVGHLVGLSRRLYETYADTHQGIWDKGQVERYEVRGKVLGVVGLGNIGRAVARVAEQLGLRVLFHDTRGVAKEVGLEMGWESVSSLDSLFRASDIVTLHLSATDAWGESNAGRITGDLLMALGADRPEDSPRLFINLSRGFLHSTEDLLAAIAAGKIRRAAVDVYPDEPAGNGPGWANPYAKEPRVMTTPHIGAATQEAQPRIARRVAQTMQRFADHGDIRDCVYSPRTVISLADDHHAGRAVLQVVHSTTRGTKKALDDAIYEADASNLASHHEDFEAWGLAVDVSLIDRPLSESQLRAIAERTTKLTGDANAVRVVRQIIAG